MARSTARKRALNTLFEADVRGQEFTDLLDARIVYPGAQTPLPTYAIEIVQGVAHHRRTIDKALSEASTSWEVKRMPAIDRNLARMATWEIVYNEEIPAGVAINEAIALAKTYAGDETPDFLFGVLSTIEKKAQDIRQEEIEWQNQRAVQAEEDAAHDADSSHNDTQDEVEDVESASVSADEAQNFDDISITDFGDALSSADSDNADTAADTSSLSQDN
ncbi:transcription antitermination factor NusB [Alloscardovia criceti]|uniref:transcription antitermination factor NusB n=1 Tax=Alloscardovia criceti TaxID=356828 RepID=UPI000368484C|nr:transcription antitermination factor NusB [Alloscardovia criceti]